jgi:hypothetical protein
MATKVIQRISGATDSLNVPAQSPFDSSTGVHGLKAIEIPFDTENDTLPLGEKPKRKRSASSKPIKDSGDTAKAASGVTVRQTLPQYPPPEKLDI